MSAVEREAGLAKVEGVPVWSIGVEGRGWEERVESGPSLLGSAMSVSSMGAIGDGSGCSGTGCDFLVAVMTFDDNRDGLLVLLLVLLMLLERPGCKGNIHDLTGIPSWPNAVAFVILVLMSTSSLSVK